MTINLGARAHELIIGSQNWTNWIDASSGIQIGYPEYDTESGLLIASGTITLSQSANNSGIPLPSSPNYRLNPNQWKRGQTISIKVANPSGTLTSLPCSGNLLYILKPTQAPTRTISGINLISLNVGCRLALDYFPPEPNKDVSGVIAGTFLDRNTIISNILNFLNISNSIGSLPYPIDYPLPKTSGNWLSMCGQLAYSAGYYLRCNVNGTVIAVPINLDISSNIESYIIGTDEKDWQPIGDSSDQPIEKLIVAGVKQVITPVDKTPSVIIEYEPLGKLLPKTTWANPQQTTISKKTTKIIKESSPSFYVEKESIEEPIGVILPKANASFPQQLTASKEKETTYILSKGSVVGQVIIEQQPIGVILPKTNASFPQQLTTSKEEIISWVSTGDQIWTKTYSLKEPIGVALPKVSAVFPQELTVSQSYTDDKDKTGPPTNIGDISTNKIIEVPIKAEVIAMQLAPDSNRPRQRTINLPFATEVDQLSKFGKLFNKFLSGRSLGWQFGGAITHVSIDPTFAPLAQISVIDLDTIYFLKIDAIQYSLNQQSAFVLWNGIEVGVANIATPTQISRPVTITLGIFELVVATKSIALNALILFDAIAIVTSSNSLPSIAFNAIVLITNFNAIAALIFRPISIITQAEAITLLIFSSIAVATNSNILNNNIEFAAIEFNTNTNIDLSVVDAVNVINAIEATGITLSSNQKNAITNRIVNAQSDGVWSKLTAYYGFVGGTANAHAINWKNPSSYLINWIGTLTHNATGVKGDGSTGYGDTGINPSLVLSNASLHLAAYQTIAKTNPNNYEMGCYNDSFTNGTYLVNQNSTLYFQHGLNDYVGSSSNSGARAYLAGDVSSGTGKTFFNNALVNSVSFATSSSNSLITRNLFILNLNHNSATNYKSDGGLGSVLISEGLTDTERNANYTSELAFQTALGRN